MKLNRLGTSALEVSEICLGTMTWGEQNTEAEGHAQIEWALEHGLPLAGIALAFARTRFFVNSVIIGATSIRQLDELAGFFELKLSKETQDGIEAVNTLYPSPCAQ